MNEPLKILPIGGLGEIGLNCMVLEYEDELIVIDCGLLFSDLDHFGVEFIIPDITYLLERKEKVKAFILTHGHEDHIGALPLTLKSGFEHVPVYCSHFTSLLLRERLKEYGMTEAVHLNVFKMGDKIQFKHFGITPVSVNHSIVDAAALFIDTPFGKVIHTGDFKVDPQPFIGSTIDLNLFKKAGDEGVLLLMSDSTNVERHEHTMSENIIFQKFEHLFGMAEGLIVVAMFASNIARMSQVFKLVQKMGKRILLSGRTMEQNVRLGTECGYIDRPESVLITADEIDTVPRNQIIVLSTGSQGEYRSGLIRMSNGEHSQIKLQEGDLVLMSSKFIPGNEKAIGRMVNNLFKQGAEVLYEAVHDLHVSGHATRPELKQMIELTRPKYFLPIHGEYRHLVHHSKLAQECGMNADHVLIAINGDLLELTKDRFEIVEHFEELKVLVEGREGGDITKLVLRERRQMGETGVVFALCVRNLETGRIISGPEILFRGLVEEGRETDLSAQSKRVAQKIIVAYEQELREGHPKMDLQETIRVDLRRFFLQVIGKKPVVLPIVLDL